MKFIFLLFLLVFNSFSKFLKQQPPDNEQSKKNEELIKKIKAKNEKTREALKQIRDSYNKAKQKVKNIQEERKNLENELMYYKENIEKENEMKEFYSFFNSYKIVTEIRKIKKNLEEITKQTNLEEIINNSDSRVSEMREKANNKIDGVFRNGHDVERLEGLIKSEYINKIKKLEEKIFEIEKENVSLEKKIFELEQNDQMEKTKIEMKISGLI